MDKARLDNILEECKVQPVGNGYIDIIVSRYNYTELICAFVTKDFKITSISWWEWCENNNESKYGLGGPESIFYEGWFSEIPINVDDFNFSADTPSETIIRETLNKIETKTIAFPKETVTFRDNNCLTPAIWLDIPKEWRNKYNA